jgi:muconolactone D-isomerase
MAMFLVHMRLSVPADIAANRREYVKSMYAAELEAAKPYLDSGEMARCFRVPGTRDHYALWDVADVQTVHDAYTNFPMFPWMTVTITPLCTNPNDPGTPYAGCPGLSFTWKGLNEFYLRHLTGQMDQRSAAQAARGEGETVILDDSDPDAVISIHTHPHSPFPAEFHLMAGDVKVAEIGPDENRYNEAKAPRYVDILAEWDGAPVGWHKVKARVMADNKVLHPDYNAALNAPRAWF